MYGSPDRCKRKLLWEALKHVIPLDASPCLFMSDFNAILSANDHKILLLKENAINSLEIL